MWFGTVEAVQFGEQWDIRLMGSPETFRVGDAALHGMLEQVGQWVSDDTWLAKKGSGVVVDKLLRLTLKWDGEWVLFFTDGVNLTSTVIDMDDFAELVKYVEERWYFQRHSQVTRKTV